jgi:hypothetical protein
MNLFVLHLNTVLAARYHADKHVVKMLLEACQLLYSAHWTTAYPELLNYRYSVKLSEEQKKLSVPESMRSAPCSQTHPDLPGFRPVHLQHPCAQWVREIVGNYYWACQLALALADEYTYRFGNKVHSCEAHARWLLDNIPDLPSFDQTEFVQAMYPEFKKEDAVEAYRAYYRGSKGERGLLQYTKREIPEWI